MTASRLWALDGARVRLDRSELLDGAEPGELSLPVPTFLVEHAEGLVLLDTGLAPAAATDAEAVYGPELANLITFSRSEGVDRQLADLGFATSDVTHVVVSHVHFDHTGGVGLFPQARFVLGAGDREHAFGDGDIARQQDFAQAGSFDWTFPDGDLDLFGDGAVVVLAMPGHTPGNTSLLVRLPHRTILFSADTAHLHSALGSPAPMSADTDRADALASLHRLRDVAAETGAEVWVNHDPDDWQRFGAPGEIT